MPTAGLGFIDLTYIYLAARFWLCFLELYQCAGSILKVILVW